MAQDEDFSISAETLLTASRFRVDRVTQTFANGSTFQREIVEHPGAVVIVPILSDGRICLIRNFRVAVRQWLLEFPAGTLEPGEPPVRTAERELIEETGYRASNIQSLCQFFMSPGILNERMHAFVATGLTEGAAAREAGEQISNYLVTPAEVDGLIASGQIQDAKTLAAWLFFQKFQTRV